MLHARCALAALVLVTAASTAEAEDRRVKLINESSQTIREFYASNIGSDDWEEDILGPDMVPPGGSVTINLDDGSGYCKFDFKTVMLEGGEVEERDVNVCEIGVYRITD